MFKLWHTSTRAQTAKSTSITQQIRALEQRVLVRRHLLHHQVATLRQAFHQKVATSINTLLVSGVVMVVGYFASRRIFAASTRADSAESTISSSALPARVSAQLPARPAGIIVTTVVELLRLFARVMFFFARVLRFFVFFIDALGIAKLMMSVSSHSMSTDAPVKQMEPTSAFSLNAPIVTKRKS